MVKIKRKVEMTLPELIAWAWKNDVKGKSFNSKKQINALHFDMYGGIQTHCGIEKNDAFTVETEEEITENTVIFRLLEARNAIPSKKTDWQDLKLLKSYLYGNHSISEVKNEYSVAFYILNDDMTTTLIWKDGELVGDE